jgi:four helix bundle protein
MSTKEQARVKAKAQPTGHSSASLPPPLPLPTPLPRFASFRDMPVWQAAMEIAQQVFTLTDSLPRKEDYGFTSQIRRSALSISANIAEAFGRSHSLDKVNFYYIARGSVTETQSHIEYGRRVGYLDSETAEALAQRLASVYNDINKVIRTLKDTSRTTGRG